jgi:hypothetical protein
VTTPGADTPAASLFPFGGVVKTRSTFLAAALMLFAAAVMLLSTAGCSSQATQAQTAIGQLQAADQAAIAATTAAQKQLAAGPTTGPSYAQAEQVLQQAQTVEAEANAALASAQTAAAVVQAAGSNAGQVLSNPAVQSAASTAVSAIPSPYAPLISLLLPYLLSGAGMALQTSTHKATIAAGAKPAAAKPA